MSTPLPVNTQEIPDELKALPQWVNWKEVSKGKSSKPDKLPLDPNRIKKLASPTNKATWGSFDQAENNLDRKEVRGLGFCLTNTDEYIVIDIDHCIDPNGNLHHIALFWAELFDSYTEISPSGTGIHIFVKGEAGLLIGGGKRTKVKDCESGLGFEIYQTARYFTVTGQPLIQEWEECGEIQYAQGVIELFFNTYFKTGRKSKIWKPIDGVVGEGDRNSTMQQIIGHMAAKIVDAIDAQDEVLPEGGLQEVLTTVLEHYNAEFFRPPLSSSEMKAQIRSSEKYLVERQEISDEYLSDDSLDDVDAEDETEEEDEQTTAKIETKRLVQRFVYAKDQAKFYDSVSGSLITKEAIDFANGQVKLVMKVKGERKRVELSHFIKYSKHAQIVDNITWIPGEGTIVVENNKVLFNSYQEIDFSRLPRKTSTKEMFLYIELLSNVVPDKDLQEAFLDFMAFTLQYPEQKINYGVLLVSTYEGIGKDLLLRPLVDIMGSQAIEMTCQMLAESFNEYLDKRKVLVIGEVHSNMFKNKMSLEAVLKPLLAAPPRRLNINGKGDKPRQVANVCSVFLMSNYIDAIPLQDPEVVRRYLAIHSECKPLKSEFYFSYVKWLNNGGTEHVIKHLMERDVDHFDFTKTPYKTDFLKKMSWDASGALFNRVRELYEKDAGSRCHDKVFIKLVDVIDDLDDSRVDPKAVLGHLKMLGYHYFGTSHNDISKKVYKELGSRKNKQCKVLMHKDNRHFKMLSKASGRVLDVFYEKQYTTEDLDKMGSASLKKEISKADNFKGVQTKQGDAYTR